MNSKILIAGASARAAVQSAIRAGLQPLAVDSFADLDLRAACPVHKVAHYPFGLPAAARSHPHCPWMYTGAVENYPGIIDAISRDRPLFGNSSETVAAVRDPWQIAQAFLFRGIPYPEIRRPDGSLPAGQWLSKPFRSGGGRCVRRVCEDSTRTAGSIPANKSHYFQRYIAGQPTGAVFVGSGQRALLLGMTKQLCGNDEQDDGSGRHRNEFAYAGSIGPLTPSTFQQAQLDRIGQCLVEEFRLVGLFGVDMILAEDQLTVLEVNPRYTASVEILERAFPMNAISLHVAGCNGQQLTNLAVTSATDIKKYGKAIVYSQQPVVISSAWSELVERANSEGTWPRVADIPENGSLIEAFHPICTVFAEGDTMADTERRLRSQVETTHSLLSTGT